MRDRFRKGQHWHTIEGAFYFSEGDYHYVIYSGNCYQNEYYFLGYAAAKTSERDLTKIKFEKMPDSNTYAPLERLMSLYEEEQIALEVASTNARAIRLYQKLGFVKTEELCRWYQVGAIP